MQYLWSLGLDWDETPPPDVVSKWTQYMSEIEELSQISIPRCVFPTKFITCEVHGFCDASERGYSAVVYFKVTSNTSDNKIYLIYAKSKVAPLKKLSIPRLELCAAVLLSDILELVINVYAPLIKIDKYFAYSDSQIVLTWIKSSPHKWHTFVSNRVSHIQEKTSSSIWNHIPGVHNVSADICSRGMLPSALVNFSQWWTGPDWLKLPQNVWPIDNSTPPSLDSEDLEESKTISLLGALLPNCLDELMGRYSSLSNIQRVLALVLRFISNLSNRNPKKYGPISLNELKHSLLILVKHVQYVEFSNEISSIKEKKLLSKPIRKLNPFLDSQGILRVGGRLVHSQLSYDKKFPALLPQKHRLTTLIITDMHEKYLHPGPQALHFLLMQNYWILSAKRVIHSVLSKCHKCWHINPRTPQPYMGDLPSVRISQARCFSSIGVDYGGPFYITLSRSRGIKSQKAYVCLFICLCTKAVHLELASDLTTEAFLAALRRFIARRNMPSHIYSDQGTNFTSASKEITKYMQEAASHESIEWHFNPPSAPHFGGIWEAGIKSVKKHLSRVIGEQILTYEELYSVLVQIEAVLNSRPLCPVSSDPNDLSVLTPGHFLTLEPLTSLPYSDITDLNKNRLSRWQLLQRLHQDFWSRWHKEYLHTLQQRGKWCEPSQPIVVGTMVLIKNELLPPLKWQLARVIAVHPGHDGISRVVTLRTPSGTLQRPVVKVCPLPSN